MEMVNTIRRISHVFLFSMYFIGHSQGTDSATINKEAAVAHPEAEPFLTSFIENGELYLNIPENILHRPMLFVRYDETKGVYQFMQVIWSLKGDKIILMSQSVESTAGIIIPFKRGLPLMENILATFPLHEKYAEQAGYRINFTKLVLGQDITWPQWSQGLTGNPVSHISLLLDTQNLDNEVIIKTRRGLMLDKTESSIPVYFNFIALGEPMKSRRYDYRMGFWNEEIFGIGYGIHNKETNNRLANISRWRLEKKHKGQELSVPKKPITFILSPAIPRKWRSYIRAGIEEWIPAFEAAGFKDAIVVREVDSLSDWDRNSINNNIVHWKQSKYFRGGENKEYGGTISRVMDYRTGEILKSNIYLAVSRQNMAERFFIRSAPLNTSTQKFPLPDDVIGLMYQYVAAHEAGHAFGLKDNNFGEYSYPLDKMGDIEWLETMGYTPSIMNYSRPNNIAQPEDSIPPSLLIQKVGPTDRYNIQWAYTEFPPGITDAEEEDALEHMIRLQDSIPWYRYSRSQFEVIGPANTNEVVETDDPVGSSIMALRNLKRVIDLLPKACIDDKDSTRLKRLYDKTLELWYHHMRHVVSLIGGYDIHYKSLSQPGNIYEPVDLETHMEALNFLFKNAFNPPTWLATPTFDVKLRYSVNPDKILEYQQLLVMELLRPQRLKRLEYMEKLPNYERILHLYLSELQRNLFKELNEQSSVVKPRNSEIHLTYIDKLVSIIQQERKSIIVEEKNFDYTDYSRGLVMEQLVLLKKAVEKAIRRSRDEDSLGHWMLCLQKLDEISK